MKTYAITIARGFGSGGREIASRLADELGIHSYENRILTLAAQYSGRDEQDFVEVDERLRGTYLTSQLRPSEAPGAGSPEKGIFLRRPAFRVSDQDYTGAGDGGELHYRGKMR